ncbi:MAG: hypothetical protein ACI4VF_02920 [Lachnospirales bacterium]
MERLRVADININIKYKYETMIKQCEAYKYDFDKPNVTIELKDEDIENIKKDSPHLSYSDIEYIFTGAAFYEALLHFNGFMLHSSGVVKDGYAYLFSADSGTGKSTHTELWQKYFGEDNAVIINDDKPAIRMVDNELYVYGTPWSGKTDKNLNMRVPIGAIVFLERSVNNNWVKEISVAEAIPLILEQTFRPRQKDMMIKLLDMLDVVLKNVRVFKIGVDMSEDAVITSYNGIKMEV